MNSALGARVLRAVGGGFPVSMGLCGTITEANTCEEFEFLLEENINKDKNGYGEGFSI
jgi:hypothetical protein